MHKKYTISYIIGCTIFAWLFVHTVILPGGNTTVVSDVSAQETFPEDVILPGIPEYITKQILTIQATPAPSTEVAHNSVHVPITEANQHSIHVPVLMYHYIRNMFNPEDKTGSALSTTPDNFEKQMAYVKENNFTTISPQQFYEAVMEGKPLPPKPILLTFDDGYADFYTEALRVIEKYDVKVSILVPTDKIGTPNYMNWEQINKIAVNPNITIISHTRHHYFLPQIPIAQYNNEISQSRILLEKNLGKSIDFFGYPYGGFNEEIVKEVKKAGYKMAFSTRGGSFHHSNEQYMVKRISVDGYDLARFSALIGS